MASWAGRIPSFVSPAGVNKAPPQIATETRWRPPPPRVGTIIDLLAPEFGPQEGTQLRLAYHQRGANVGAGTH